MEQCPPRPCTGSAAIVADRLLPLPTRCDTVPALLTNRWQQRPNAPHTDIIQCSPTHQAQT